VDEGEVAVGGFIVAGGKSPRVFDLVEAAFDHVAQGIDGGIDRQLDQSVTSWVRWNAG
jgi:hypothetical protein